MIRLRSSFIDVWQMDIQNIVMKAKVLCCETVDEDKDEDDTNNDCF